MTRRQRTEARRAAEVNASRRVEIRIEGYLAARRAELTRSAKTACPYVGWEAAMWEAGWWIAMKDAGRW